MASSTETHKALQAIKHELERSIVGVPDLVKAITVNSLRPKFSGWGQTERPRFMPDVVLGNDFVFSEKHPMPQYETGLYKGPLIQVDLSKLNRIYGIWDLDWILQIFVNDEDIGGQNVLLPDSGDGGADLYFRYIPADEARRLWELESTSKSIDINAAYESAGIDQTEQNDWGVLWEKNPVPYHVDSFISGFDYFRLNDDDQHALEFTDESVHFADFYREVDQLIATVSDGSGLVEKEKVIGEEELHCWGFVETLYRNSLLKLLTEPDSCAGLIPVFHFAGPASGVMVDQYSVFIDRSGSFLGDQVTGKAVVLMDRYY